MNHKVGTHFLKNHYKWAFFINLVVVLLAFILSWWATNNIEKLVKSNAGSVLTAVRKSTQEAVNIWVFNQKEKLANIAAEPNLNRLTQALLDEHKQD